jgi:cysteinyl-tRNA synthetase
MTTIRLYNTATKAKEELRPLDPSNVRMYVCGPTVYDRAHLGNARPVVVFDVLFRLLRHVYGAEHVTYVRNFTDVDDKINAEALRRRQAGAEGALEDLIRQRTEETIGWYHADMDALGALRPTHEPRATEFIAPMVAMIEMLIAKGHAYEVQGHVLFDVRSYAEYGKLSGRSVDDMIAGARAETAPGKRDPMDFVLWKPSDAETPGWDSPWGRGRPGWHIECSAMSHELLGPAFDIHGGGIDLQFPHHENEIAQSRCAHPDEGFAKVWMHNEMLLVEGKKMSKSLGNFFTVRDLLDQGVPGEVIRFVLLSTHYSKPMDWTERKREDAEKRLDALLPALAVAVQLGIPPSHRFLDLPEGMKLTLVEDLNFAGAISALEWQAQLVMQVQSGEVRAAQISQQDALVQESLAFVTGLDVVGLFDLLLKRSSLRLKNFDLIDKLQLKFQLLYEFARADKDFTKVDEQRKLLADAGLEVRISRGGIELVTAPHVNRAKLEALL